MKLVHRSLYYLICIIVLLFCRQLQGQNFPSNQPYASYWHPVDLLTWSPATDADAEFNRSSILLKTRFNNAVTNVNAHAAGNEAKVAALDIFWTTAGNPSQGSLLKDYYCFNYWQYVDVMVFWGGSAGEGLILAPNGGIVDAAHTNGVPVLGTIFFPPTAYGGQIQWVRDFVQKEGDVYPVADKLIEMADYYGFDGYFINQETAGGNAALASEVINCMKYIQDNSELRIMWYDAMTESGSVSWQDQLNSNNDGFFQDGETLVSDNMFLDFGWSGTKLSNSRDYAQTLGRSEYDLYAGVDVQSNSYNTYVNWNGIFPEEEDCKTSLGLYVSSSTFHKGNITEFYPTATCYQRANRFWVGPSGNPANTTTASWPGLAHYIPATSAINTLPFVTNFCTGQGTDYYIQGNISSAQDWNNIGLQDLLPTWRWLVESSGEKLSVGMDWEDAYYGGNCLKVSGNLTADNLIKLYKTDVTLTENTFLDIAFKSGENNTATGMKVGLLFEDDMDNYQYVDIGSTTSADWNMRRLEMNSYAGRTLSTISLFFEGGTAADYTMKIGRLGLHEAAPGEIDPPHNLQVVNKVEDVTSTASVRLRWTPSDHEVKQYNVYRRNEDNSLTFLGGTANTSYFVAGVNREGDEAAATIEVQAVSPWFDHSASASTTIDWIAANPPQQVSEPEPADGYLAAHTTTNLYWKAGVGALSHDLYFGTTNPPQLIGNQVTSFYTPEELAANTTYYWRVDEKNDSGSQEGEVWSFKTQPDGTVAYDRTDLSGAIITVRGENLPNQGKTQAFDNNINTKWLDFAPETWLEYRFGAESSFCITEYTLTSAEDAEERDPASWSLQGSSGGNNWIELDSRSAIDFPTRRFTRRFSFVNFTTYEYYRFEFKNNTGAIFQIAEIELISYPSLTGIETDPLPRTNRLEQNYPNPFNPATKINYALKNRQQVSMVVFNSKGELVRTLVDKTQPAGRYSLSFDGSGLNSGLYFYQLKTGETTMRKKMIMLK